MLEFLKSILGDAYTEEIDQKISEEVGKIFVPKNDFNGAKTEIKSLKEQVAQRDSQLEELKKSSGDNETLRQQISTLQKENAEQAKSFSEQISKMKLDHAVEKALTDARAKNITAAKALLADFLKDAKLGEDGKTVNGLGDAIKNLCEGESTAFLFDQKSDSVQVAGAKPAAGSTSTVGAKEAEYQSKFSEAKKAGNTLLMIQLKREAKEKEGIILN